MSKWDEEILVVGRDKIFNNEEFAFYGFLPKDNANILNILFTNKFREGASKMDVLNV